MSIGVRNLTVLGEFKPFGLLAETLDGKPADDITGNYKYFLFDSNITNGETDDYVVGSDDSDHELFIRGNRIIWTMGLRVYKRFTLPSAVIMACWCRLGVSPGALLCVLQVKGLTVFNTAGEVVSIKLPHDVTSIWPLPFGLLMQQGIEGILPTLSLSASPLVSQCDASYPKHDVARCAQHKPVLPHSRICGTSLSSHLILKDPHEEPQLIFFEESGKQNTMMGFDERTIWTSDRIPLMATYNKGKMRHTLWSLEVIDSNIDVLRAGSNDFIPDGVLQKQFYFRRIWQENEAHFASSKVFLATDDDSIPIVCFLLQEQKKLQCVRLQSVVRNSDIIFDIQPDISWCIAVITAEPVAVTRPSVKLGQLPFIDILALVSDNTLLLYSGKQPLCRFSLPSCLYRSPDPHNLNSSETAFSFSNLKIIGLSDAIDGRVNVILDNGHIFRCALHRSPSSSLANDCITALAEGLSSNFYNHFLVKLWADGDLAHPSSVNSNVNLEWEYLSSVILQMCGQMGYMPKKPSGSVVNSSWGFLCNSKFHKNYCQHNDGTIVSSVTLLDFPDPGLSESCNDGTVSLEKRFYSEIVTEILSSLHAIYETLKLNILRKRDIVLLVPLLCKIADCLSEDSYLDHYIRDFPTLSKKFRFHNTSFSQRPAPCIFRWLEVCLQSGSVSANINDLPPLILEDRKPVISWARKIISFYSILFGAERVGRKLSTGVYCNIAQGSYSIREELTVLTMVGEKFGLQQLDLLPAGVSLPLRHALDKCRESPPNDWPPVAYVLLGREDLALSTLKLSTEFKDFDVKNIVNLISVSTPYMLHLHPVTIPFTTSDNLGLGNTRYENADSTDASLMDGMEHIFSSTTQLRYGRDMRLNEVRCVLCSARPVAIQTSTDYTASDQDSQQAQLWQFAQRTAALPLGRGAFTIATISTLFTEAFTVPKLVLAGRLPAQQNATIKLDPERRDVREFKAWAEFHNAVASGLRLVPFQEKMSRTWIMYNKPAEPSDVHAGLLLALGLHGFLHVLNISDIYQYLALEHESTSVGLMLGLAASYRGTMKASISKCFYFHIPSRHPSSFPDLEVPTILQSAALVSLGLLHEGSAHTQTMQILLDEIGRRSAGDNVVEKEGYAVSAGFSLGLVALGRGDVATGSMYSLVNKLLRYVGSKELHSDGFLPFPLMDEYNHRSAQIMDTTPFNVDVTAPGATIALALLFLKTGSEVIVSRISIPCTCFELKYVRPDFIILRVIARNLIMWSRVQASSDWIQTQIPEIINDGVKSLFDNFVDVDEMDVEVFVQAYVNIVAGACISIGLKFAGTRDGNAQEMLYDYALYFLNEIMPVCNTSVKNFPKGLSRYVDRGTLEICLHFILLSLSVVMAGSGHLQTFGLLRFLRNRYSAEGHANYGMQLVVSLAIGFLFLGGGMMTFSTNNSSIAALLITLYPHLPTGPNDNCCHLQAFRHLYVLATEARWIQTVDVNTGLTVYAPLEVTIRETEHYAETSFCDITPCILPERAILKSVRVCGPRYWHQLITLVPEDNSWWRYGDKKDPFNSSVLYIKRKVGASSYIDDPVGCQSLLSEAMHKVCGLSSVETFKPNSNGVKTISQVVSTFSSDPSLTAFSQLFSDPSWKNGSDVDFQEFCLQVLFECVTKDSPPILQVYLSLNTMIRSMSDQVTSGTIVIGDSLFISSLKIALAYNDALLSQRLTSSNGPIIQSAFLGSLRKRIQLILNHPRTLSPDLNNYLCSSKWPQEDRSIHLSWYLQWFSVPSPAMIASVVDKIKSMRAHSSSSSLSLLSLLLPRTHSVAIDEINNL